MRLLQRMNPLVSLLTAALAWASVFTDGAVTLALLVGSLALLVGNLAWALR